MLIACRLEDEGARSACVAMADARVAYVGPPSTTRKVSVPPAQSTHQASRTDSAVVATRLTSAESLLGTTDPLRKSPSSLHIPLGPQAGSPQASTRPQESISVLYPAPLDLPGGSTDDDLAPRSQTVAPRSRAASPLPTSSHTALNADIVGSVGQLTCTVGCLHVAIEAGTQSLQLEQCAGVWVTPLLCSWNGGGTDVCLLQSLVTAQPDIQHSVPTPRSILAPPGLSPYTARPSIEGGQGPLLASGSVRHYLHWASSLGVIVCINAKRPDAQLLIEVVAEVCSPPLALLLQQHWLRRDRFKRMLQLELHRTVLQVGNNCRNAPLETWPCGTLLGTHWDREQ